MPEPEAAGTGTARPEPRVVRRVVCGYQQGTLPGAWLQTWRRLERALQRAGLDVKATLAPLDGLPDDTDVLVVPPELREAARTQAGPGVRILITPASAAAGAFADLVRRLEKGTDIVAARVDPSRTSGPKLVTYRGSTRLD